MSRKDAIKKLTIKHQRRLQKLEEQRASYGLDTPPHILTEIEDINAEIERLQAELETFGDDDVDEKPLIKPPVYHNLPQPDYIHFVGRDEELNRVHELLSPNHRAWVITIDGIGGIGKSALVLEVAHHYLRNYDRIPSEEHFEAIIWTSAKQSVLTAEGIVLRRQVLRTLDDIYTTIAVVLQREDITRARPEERDEIVRNALTQQRTLLIVDNLETVDDETVITFLRELPAPTKAIVTTRHRIDVAYPVRLTGMTWENAKTLIVQECEKIDLTLSEDDARHLYDRIGGVPLAIVWSIAQMGFGYSVKTVLSRLEQPTGDITRFCFAAAAERIRDKPAHRLLMALSLFTTDANREAIGYVADLPESDRDEGLVELEKLSLVNRSQRGRFWMLPLTKDTIANSTLDAKTIIEFRNRQVEYYLKNISRPGSFQLYPKALVDQVKDELENIFDLLEWCKTQEEYRSLLELFLRINGLLGEFGKLDIREQWSIQIIEAAKAVGATTDLGVLYVAMGWLTIKRGELVRARRYLERGLELIRQDGEDHEAECLALRYLGRVEEAEGHSQQALQTYQHTLDLAMEGGFDAVAAGLYSDLAYWEMQNGILDKAERNIREAINRFEELNDIVRASGRSIMLANILVLKGKYSEAEEILMPSLDRVEKELGQLQGIASGYVCLAHIHAHRGSMSEAKDCCARAKQIYKKIGMRKERFPIGLPEVCEE